MRVAAICFVFVSQLTLLSVGQQAASAGKSAEVICAFEDGKEMKVEYSNAPANRREEFREGKLWSRVDRRCFYLPRLRSLLAVP